MLIIALSLQSYQRPSDMSTDREGTILQIQILKYTFGQRDRSNISLHQFWRFLTCPPFLHITYTRPPPPCKLTLKPFSLDVYQISQKNKIK